MQLEEIKADKVMDIRGLKYPLPLKKTINAIRGLNPGDVLEVWCSDPDSKADLLNFDAHGGGTLMGHLPDPEGYTRYFLIKSKLED